MKKRIFPFTAIEGQTELKKALLLNLIDTSIGGVLAIGDKGTGKTTLIRSLINLMSNENNFPFVNLPIGALEDRLIGSIDLETLVNNKTEVVKPGLLNQANGGVLYVDEVNLLPSHLMDILLDASAFGQYHIERDGISKVMQSSFILVGSMNPEEGELRSQLKDRFGLGVNISTSQDVLERRRIVKKRLEFDTNAESFIDKYKAEQEVLTNKIIEARKILSKVKVTNDIVDYCVQLSIDQQVEGMRADIIMLKAAKAHAAFCGQNIVSIENVNQISDLVLFHRKKINSPANSDHSDNNHPHLKEETDTCGDEQTKEKSDDNQDIKFPNNEFNQFDLNKSNDGQIRNKKLSNTKQEVNINKTVSQYLVTDKFELKNQLIQKEKMIHYIFLLDASGSMLSNHINDYAKGAVEKIAANTKNQKTHYSLVVINNDEANILVKNSPTLEQLVTTLKLIETGGKTNLVAGLKKVKQLAINPDCIHNLIMITDGKFKKDSETIDYSIAFSTLCKGIESVDVIDAEQGLVKLGMAKEFATMINASYQTLNIN